MSERKVPYSAFNFVVSLDERPVGGFSEVSGLSTEIQFAEYRAGNDPENHVQKVPGMHTVGDVTLKRGIIDSNDLWAWITSVRRNGYSQRRDMITITLMDETNAQAVMKWNLINVLPKTYNGPTLNASGGEELAMEELVLSVEGIEIE